MNTKPIKMQIYDLQTRIKISMYVFNTLMVSIHLHWKVNRNVATGGDTATHSRKAPEPKHVHSPAVVAQNEKKEEEKAKAIETIDQKTKISRGDENKLPANAIERTTGDDKRLVEEERKDNVKKEAADREQVAPQKQVTTIDREEKAKSARERYLARKRKDLDS